MDTTQDGPFHNNRVHVLTEKCATCVFRPGNLMRLAPGRLADLIATNVDAGSALQCHDTLPYGEHPTAEPAICRGFWDSQRERVPVLRLAQMMDIVCEIPPPG